MVVWGVQVRNQSWNSIRSQSTSAQRVVIKMELGFGAQGEGLNRVRSRSTATYWWPRSGLEPEKKTRTGACEKAVAWQLEAKIADFLFPLPSCF